MRDEDEFPFDDAEKILDEFLSNFLSQGAGPRPSSSGNTADGAHADVVEYEETVQLVGDFPGISKDLIDVHCNERSVELKIDGFGRQEIKLPASVDPQSASATFQNGVLTIEFEKTDDSPSSIDLN